VICRDKTEMNLSIDPKDPDRTFTSDSGQAAVLIQRMRLGEAMTK
jgi:hypothetical protein